MSQIDFKALEFKVNQLLDVSRNLRAQNEQLAQENQTLKSERAKIIQQNDSARSKVEAMISRLRALEH